MRTDRQILGTPLYLLTWPIIKAAEYVGRRMEVDLPDLGDDEATEYLL